MPDSAIDSPEFIKTQKQFAQSIRDPLSSSNDAQFEERRLKIYRELFFNNVEGFVSSAFPVLKEILIDQHDESFWLGLVRQFFIQHQCETPYFLEISEEFLQFLQANMESGNSEDLPDYAWQLAHWEWMELHADVADAQTSMLISTLAKEQLLNAKLTLAETAWVCAYDYPVHKISAEMSDLVNAPTYLMVYRNGQDEVGFNELNPLSATLFESVRQQPGIEASYLLEQLAEQSGLDHELVVSGGLEILSQWQQLCILYAE